MDKTGSGKKKVLEKLGFLLLHHPPNSPDSALPDFYLFPKLKKKSGCQFGNSLCCRGVLGGDCNA